MLNEYVPLPNSAGQSLHRSPNVEDMREQFGTRLDYQLTSNQTLLGRYMRGHTERITPRDRLSPAGNRRLATLQDVMGSDNYVISPT